MRRLFGSIHDARAGSEVLDLAWAVKKAVV